MSIIGTRLAEPGHAPRRLSADPAHPWFDALMAPRYRVLLDGNRLEQCMTASIDEGFVELYEWPRKPGQGLVVRHGRVEFVALRVLRDTTPGPA